MKPGAVKTGFGRGYLLDIWHFAGLSREVGPGRLKRRMLAGEPIALGRTRAGALFALRDVCPHRAAPLSAGRIVGEGVECAYHGWRFGRDGRCLAIPSLAPGQAFDLGRIAARAYPVAERRGLVFVWLGERLAEPDREPPEIPIPPGRPKMVIRRVFAAHVDQAVVGLMDPAHGPFVHQQWWWRSRASAHEKAKRFAPREAGFAMVRHPPSANSRAYRLLGGTPSTEITFHLPGLRWEEIEAGRRRLLALTALSPLAAEATEVTQMVWSDHPLLTLIAPIVRLAAGRFLDQDAAVIALQNVNRDFAGPPIWIDDADTQAKWYQALKREWRASRAEGRAFANPLRPTTLRWVS